MLYTGLAISVNGTQSLNIFVEGTAFQPSLTLGC